MSKKYQDRGEGKVNNCTKPNLKSTLDFMSQHKNKSFYSLYREHVLQFLAELLNATSSAATPDAFQRAVQRFCDDLRPWVLETDVHRFPHTIFSLVAEYALDEKSDKISLRLTPEGEAFFRAWLRQPGVLAEIGRVQDSECSH